MVTGTRQAKNLELWQTCKKRLPGGTEPTKGTGLHVNEKATQQSGSKCGMNVKLCHCRDSSWFYKHGFLAQSTLVHRNGETSVLLWLLWFRPSHALSRPEKERQEHSRKSSGFSTRTGSGNWICHGLVPALHLTRVDVAFSFLESVDLVLTQE